MSSTRAWATLGLIGAVTVGGIWGVHWQQTAERRALHEGVLRDAELLALKRKQLGDVPTAR